MKRQRDNGGGHKQVPIKRTKNDDDDLDGFAPAVEDDDVPDVGHVPVLMADDDDEQIDDIAQDEENAEQPGTTELTEEQKAARAEKRKKKFEKLKAKKASKAAAAGLSAEAALLKAVRSGPADRAAETFWSSMLRTPAGQSFSSFERDQRPSALQFAVVSDEALAAQRPQQAQGAGAGAGAGAAAGAKGPATTLYSNIAGLDDLPAFIKACLSHGTNVTSLEGVASGRLAGQSNPKDGPARWKAIVGWKHAPEKLPRASPAILIVTYAARRAADMLQPLASFKTRCAKLFAKHLKLQQQVQALTQGPPTPIAVGTPARLLQLLDCGALSLDRLELLVWDTRAGPKGETALTPLPTAGSAEASSGHRDDDDEDSEGAGGRHGGQGAGAGADLSRSSWELYAKHVHPRLMAATGSAGAQEQEQAGAGSSAGGEGKKVPATVTRPLRMAFF